MTDLWPLLGRAALDPIFRGKLAAAADYTPGGPAPNLDKYRELQELAAKHDLYLTLEECFSAHRLLSGYNKPLAEINNATTSQLFSNIGALATSAAAVTTLDRGALGVIGLACIDELYALCFSKTCSQKSPAELSLFLDGAVVNVSTSVLDTGGLLFELKNKALETTSGAQLNAFATANAADSAVISISPGTTDIISDAPNVTLPTGESAVQVRVPRFQVGLEAITELRQIGSNGLGQFIRVSAWLWWMDGRCREAYTVHGNTELVPVASQSLGWTLLQAEALPAIATVTRLNETAALLGNLVREFAEDREPPVFGPTNEETRGT